MDEPPTLSNIGQELDELEAILDEMDGTDEDAWTRCARLRRASQARRRASQRQDDRPALRLIQGGKSDPTPPVG